LVSDVTSHLTSHNLSPPKDRENNVQQEWPSPHSGGLLL
jgi:hypothetical protein